jgi:glucose-6-phosphate 1-dehydrogenase
MSVKITELAAVENSPGDEVEAYERLLSDAMKGDALLFVREDAVECSWAVVEHILGNVAPLHFYEEGSWGPLEAARLAEDIGGWRNPD